VETTDGYRNRKIETETAGGLLQFVAEQQTYKIGPICVGGEPDVQPTVLIGSIFYHGHKITTDEDRGEFDAEAAEALIRQQEDFAERTGCPCMFDVVGATPEAIERHLEFVAGVTDMPLLIDGTTVEVRLAGLENENQEQVDKYKVKVEAIASEFGITKDINSVGDMFDVFEQIVFQVSQHPDDPVP